MARELAQAQATPTLGGVMQQCVLTFQADQQHEMVEVPVQDGRQLQPGQLLGLGPQAPAGQAQLGAHAHQIGHGRAFQREREALAQARQIVMGAQAAGGHGQAGQAAFGGFRLQDHRHTAASPPAQVQA